MPSMSFLNTTQCIIIMSSCTHGHDKQSFILHHNLHPLIPFFQCLYHHLNLHALENNKGK